ncbi:hypothetical protein GCM10009639_35230 [Kitasatospora putterlickiae]|uniref:Uncharacterized protein n=1 Tax=Kitasatospora putterlickiae TaxID=221725 RepID=A0ABN1Y8W8_9ACTN
MDNSDLWTAPTPVDKPRTGAAALWTAARRGGKRFEKGTWPANGAPMDTDVPV